MFFMFPPTCHLHCTMTVKITSGSDPNRPGFDGFFPWFFFYVPFYVSCGLSFGWVGALRSWHLHTSLMLRHEKFCSTSLHVTNIYIYTYTHTRYIYIYYLMLFHKNFSCTSTPTSSCVMYICITWCYVIRTLLKIRWRKNNKVVSGRLWGSWRVRDKSGAELRVKWSVGKWAVPVIINVLTFFMLTPPLKTPCGSLFFASCNMLHNMFVSFYTCIPIPILLLNFSHMSQMQVSEMLCTLQDVAHVSKMLCTFHNTVNEWPYFCWGGRVVGGAGIGEGVRVAGWGRANNVLAPGSFDATFGMLSSEVVSCNSKYALDATLFAFSWNLQHALDATLFNFSWNVQHQEKHLLKHVKNKVTCPPL